MQTSLTRIQDLEEVEEWNEYGEIKEQLGTTAPAPAPAAPTPVPSTSNPASKQPSSSLAAASKPPSIALPTAADLKAGSASLNKSSTPTSQEKPTIAGQMKSMGQEVAEKAKQMRSAKLKAAAGLAPSKESPGDKKADTEERDAADKEKDQDTKVDEEQKEALAKLDNSAPSGVPPPTGATEAQDAIAPETGDATVVSKADELPETTDDTSGETETGDAVGPESPLPQADAAKDDAPSDSLAPDSPDETAVKSSTSLPLAETESVPTTGAPAPSHHRGSSISPADAEEVRKVEEATKIQEEPEEEDEEDEEEEEQGDDGDNKEEAQKKQAPDATNQGDTIAESESSTKEEELKDEPDKVTAPEAKSADTTDSIAVTEPSRTDPAIGFEPPTATPSMAEPKSEVENQPGDKGEGHVKFGGEAQGGEMDRVKATLERSSPAGSRPLSAMASPTRPHDSEQATDSNTPAEASEVTKKLDDEKKAEPVKEPSTSAGASEVTDKLADEKTIEPTSVTPTDEGENLPGTKTQSQDAADASKAGDSVAD
jgi:hypothetical protein